MKKHLLLAAVICAALSALAYGYADRILVSQPDRAKPAPPARSLREKAKQRGNYVATSSPTGFTKFDDVGVLTAHSEYVVVGIPERRGSKLVRPAEEFIETRYQVAVTDVLKGSAAAGETITLRTPGGRVQFDDGTSAEVKMPPFWRDPEVGKTYLFFLKKRAEGFTLVGGPQGMFELSPEAGVLPQVRDEDALMINNRGKDVGSFMGEVRRAAGN
jgi:hypothetical protein